jgi:hypothetical protein
MESILLVLPGGKVSKPDSKKESPKETKTAKAEGEVKTTDKVTGVRVPLPVGFAAPPDIKPRSEFEFMAAGIIDGGELVITKLEGLPVPNDTPGSEKKTDEEFVKIIEEGLENGD